MKLFEEIEGLVSNKIGIMKTMISIVKLETRLAGLSVYPLILNICAVLIVSMGIWLTSMVLIGHSISVWSGNISLGITAVLSLNILMLLGLLKYMSFNIKNMGFEKTRAYLLKMRVTDHAELTPEIDRKPRRSRKKIALPEDAGQ